jgi:V/A-type H+-transporting ATPase subunit D
MGCELPQVAINETKPTIQYGFFNTDVYVDKAYICFEKVKIMTAALAEVDNGIYRLTNSIRKTQTRANALQNIVIPRYKKTVKFISESLEEKEREDFSRMKVIKTQKASRKKRYRVKRGESAA